MGGSREAREAITHHAAAARRVKRSRTTSLPVALAIFAFLCRAPTAHAQFTCTWTDASDSVDLIYLDPPFNRQTNYNGLFKSPTGKAADAQTEACTLLPIGSRPSGGVQAAMTVSVRAGSGKIAGSARRA
jgi:hypothetical protein